jgi:hypothetical protein
VNGMNVHLAGFNLCLCWNLFYDCQKWFTM